MSTAMKVAEVAKELDVSDETVYRLVRSRALAVSNIGTGKRPRLRITRAQLDKFLKSRESGGAR